MTEAEPIDKLNLQNQRLNELKKENEELKKQLAENECFPLKNDGTIDTCEVMKENEELNMAISKMETAAADMKWELAQVLEDNEHYQIENERLLKRSKAQQKIILDALHDTDLCKFCEKKGHDLAGCNCKKELQCYVQIMELYEGAE